MTFLNLNSLMPPMTFDVLMTIWRPTMASFAGTSTAFIRSQLSVNGTEEEDKQTTIMSTDRGPNEERQKMLAGDFYQAFDPVLTKERIQAKQLCFELNQTPPVDTEKRAALTKQLLRVDDALVESPFNVDYGYNLKVRGLINDVYQGDPRALFSL